MKLTNIKNNRTVSNAGWSDIDDVSMIDKNFLLMCEVGEEVIYVRSKIGKSGETFTIYTGIVTDEEKKLIEKIMVQEIRTTETSFGQVMTTFSADCKMIRDRLNFAGVNTEDVRIGLNIRNVTLVKSLA